MTREEITKKLYDLSQEVYALGRACNDYFTEPTLWITGEFLKNTSFTMDTFFEQLESIEE